MGSLKTFLAILAVWSGSVPAMSFPESATDRALVFADCLGRYSAQREHGWLVGGEDPHTEDSFAIFGALYAANLPDAQQTGTSEALLLHHRIVAKADQARLLNGARFHTDPRYRQRFTLEARKRLLQCEMLVFG